MEVPKSFDAHTWTGEFCRQARERGHHLDMDWMFKWFAAALQRGYDEGIAQSNAAQPATEKSKSGKK